MTTDLEPSPLDILNERLSDKALSRDTPHMERHMDAYRIALRAVLTAGAAGNMTCWNATNEIYALLQKPMITLDDDSPMPFGKHKGEPMEKVPASYLHWLWSNGMRDKINDPVADYIRRNLSSLMIEYKDGIWE